MGLGEGLFNDGPNGSVRSELRNLLHGAEADAFAHGDFPAIGFDASLKNGYERGFTGTVRADQADAIAFGYGERNILEKRYGAESFRQTLSSNERSQIMRYSPAPFYTAEK